MSIVKPKYPLLEPLERIYHHNNTAIHTPKLGQMLDDSTGRDKLHTLIKQGNYLSIVVSYHAGLANQYYCDQFDFPLRALSWFPSALEEFRKPPAEGGLHAGAMISKDKDVEGEM
nr:hypothetical protein [Cellvibrionaceae bacterium]